MLALPPRPKHYNLSKTLAESIEKYNLAYQQLSDAYRFRIDANKNLSVEDVNGYKFLYQLNPARLTLGELSVISILQNHDEICEAMDEEYFKNTTTQNMHFLKNIMVENGLTEQMCQSASKLSGPTLFSQINTYLKTKEENSQQTPIKQPGNCLKN